MRNWLLIAILTLPAALAVIPTNPGDLNADNLVNILDVNLVTGCLSQSAATCQSGRADPNNDGIVNIFDFIAVSRYWGTDYTTPPYVESCGNTYCNATAGETCNTCSADCGACPNPCGNGNIDSGEQCDGSNLNGGSCSSLGFTNGTLTCSAACQYVTSACTTVTGPVCGNGAIESGEQCEGNNFNGATCNSLGFTGGSLSCSACRIVTSACTSTSPTTFNGPNLPNGFTPVVYRQFSSKATADADRGTGLFPSKTTGSEGWDGIEYNKVNLQVVSTGYGGTPLFSSPNVMQWTYPTTQQLGSSPGTAQTQDFGTSGRCYTCPRSLKSIYVHYVFQISPNFYGATDNGVNKMLFLQGIANNFLALRGTGNNALTLQVNAQGSGNGGSWTVGGNNIGWATGNTGASTTIQRGQWYEVEWLTEAGTFGQSNGRMRVWINGVLTHDYQNIEIYASSNNANSKFTALQISPTYGSTTSLTLGGIGGQQQYLWVDTLNIWGSP